VVTELGTKADPARDRITVAGRPLPVASEPLYILLHKPVGVVTTLFDPEGRPTVRDLLRGVRDRVFPVGRLDYHSAGLVLMTNDGALALRLTHPRYGVPKTYHVKVKGEPTDEVLRQLRTGVRIEGGPTAPAQVRVMERAGKKAWLEIILREGRRREIRQMCERVGLSVEKLVRERLGPLQLGKLPPGAHRLLTGDEIDSLRAAVASDRRSRAPAPSAGRLRPRHDPGPPRARRKPARGNRPQPPVPVEGRR
jgi:23S rRNA pseudouridine2605 synthase